VVGVDCDNCSTDGGQVVPPVRESPDQHGGESITLADCSGHDEPEVALAVIGACGAQNALTLQIHHNGVDGALMAAGVHAHTPHNGGACLGTVLDESAADSGAGDGAEVHRWLV